MERSTALAGPYATVFTLPANSIAYADFGNLQAGTAYYYRVIAINSGGEVSSDTVTATTIASCSYSLDNPEVACADPGLCLPLIAAHTISDAIGFNFTIAFDTNHYDLTGLSVNSNFINPAHTTYDTHTNTDGSINILVYIKGSAPVNTSFNGIGELLCLNFDKDFNHEQGVDTFQMASVLENYNTGNTLHCVDDGIATVIKDSLAPGTLLSWNNMTPLPYDTGNPASYLITRIYGTDDSCGNVSTGFVSPDLNGDFQHPISHGDYISIERDIDSATNMMAFVNGRDSRMARRIALAHPSLVPDIRSFIAADVNMDGLITAGDVTLIRRRTTLTISEFPHGRDWLFIDSLTVADDPAYQISATYPGDDGVGYSRNRIPHIASCLEVPAVYTGNCPEFTPTTYYSVLLGDVNGNFNQILGNGGLMKQQSLSDTLYFDLEQAVINSDHTVDIPIYATSPSAIYSVDFTMDYDETELVLNAVTADPSLESEYNNYQQQELLFTSMSLQPYPAGLTVATLRFSSANSSILPADMGAITSYINGEVATTAVKGEKHSVGMTEQTLSERVDVYPNPAKNLFHVSLPYADEVALNIYDISGRLVYKQLLQKVTEGQVQTISAEQLDKGVYFLKIQVGQQSITKKLVKNEF